MWQYTGNKRPPFAIPPKPGQESVWDYPRPPALVSDHRLVRVELAGQEIARSQRCFRILETAAPPTIYIPWQDIASDLLAIVPGTSFCEWKGAARYWAYANRVDGQHSTPIAWDYPNPNRAYARIVNYLAFYPGRVDCFIDDEAVRPQQSEFYGGWITDEIVGPFKGEPGTLGW